MKNFGFIFAVVFSLSLFLTLTPAHAIPEFSVSLRPSSSQNQNNETSKKYFEQAEDTGTATASLIAYNAMVNLLKDDDGDEYCPQLTVKFDLDASKRVNYYVISYMNLNLNGNNDNDYDWFMINSSDVFTLEEGYSPDEGILYLDMEVFGGYGRLTKVSIKIEIYYEDGSLAFKFGPDDDPDLKNIMVESNDYDGKEDPFAPSPTPTPAQCVPKNISVNPNILKLDNKTSEDVTVTVTGANDCAVEGETVTATINFAGRNRISISPTSAITDENGQATFTIAAKKKAGVARITFKAGDVNKSITVKVK